MGSFGLIKDEPTNSNLVTKWGVGGEWRLPLVGMGWWWRPPGSVDAAPKVELLGGTAGRGGMGHVRRLVHDGVEVLWCLQVPAGGLQVVELVGRGHMTIKQALSCHHARHLC